MEDRGQIQAFDIRSLGKSAIQSCSQATLLPLQLLQSNQIILPGLSKSRLIVAKRPGGT